MNFEVLKKSHLKRNIIIGVVVIAIISAVMLNFTIARYRVTESIPLVNGTINYSLPDLNIVGLYIDGVEANEWDSSKTYTLDKAKSTCTYKDGSEIENLNISYESETGKLTISPFTVKGTKCTLHFNENEIASATILKGKDIQTRSDFENAFTTDTTGIVFQMNDWEGISYYFAGQPKDNYFFFAGFYWRIIRINGDGTIRIAYAGTDVNSYYDDQLEDYAFNNNNNRSYYVGLSYGTIQHGNGTSSTILSNINDWYSENLNNKNDNSKNYSQYINESIGFCNDRNVDSGNWASTSNHYYAAYIRLYTNKEPTLDCNEKDILKIPIGLVTADEIALAGEVWGKNNTNFYLFSGDYYWTMTPSNFNDGIAYVFHTGSIGGRGGDGDVKDRFGVRPVINLKADVTLSGTGTSTDPYVIAT